MFTGITEEIGYVKNIKKLSNGAEISVCCQKVLQKTKIGDSICTNGVCLTVTGLGNDFFSAMISDETLRISNLSSLKKDDKLNLERALRIQDRLGGHIVSGHIDCTGQIIAIEKFSDFYEITVEIPQNMSKYVVYKGSIAVDGISLTIAGINENRFKIAVIPHTYNITVLKYLNKGSRVNIETDILGKYVEKLLNFSDNKEKRSISIEFLKENGFV